MSVAFARCVLLASSLLALAGARAVGEGPFSRLPKGAIVRLGEEGSVLRRAGCGGPGIFAVALSPDGTRAATGTESGAEIWNVASGTLERRFPHRATVHAVEFRGDDELLWSGKAVELAREALSDEKTSFRTPEQILVGLVSAVSRDGGFALATSASGNGFRDGGLWLWRLDDGVRLRELRTSGAFWDAEFSPDGTRFATADNRGEVAVWDRDEGKKRHSWRAGAAAFDVEFSPDGERVAAVAGHPANVLVIWELATAKEILRVATDETPRALDWSPDGRWLAVAANESVVRLRRATDGREAARIRGHRDWVGSVRFSADGRRLLTASPTGCAYLWDLEVFLPRAP